jgi:hypothetical protein
MKKKNKGRKFEDKCKNSINSGALWFDKGDLKTKDHCIECKFTEKKGFRITTKLLRKLWDEALTANKLPALVIGIKDEKHIWTLKAVLEKEAI